MKYIKLFEELSSGIASRAFGAARFDDRAAQLKKDVLTHLFRDYIGRDMPVYIKTRSDNTPTKYTLVEVEYRKSEKPGDYTAGNLRIHFSADNVDIPAGFEADDSPFGDSKKDVVMVYSIPDDGYIDASSHYLFNQYAVNFLIKAAGIIRSLYFTSFPKKVDGIILPENEESKKTKLRKDHFKMFPWNSNDMLNR